jgi:hypothetical protein
MKKTLNVILISVVFSLLMTSCYTQQYIVGEGSQTGVETKAKNNYFLAGLIDGKISDAKTMASGAENYSVTIEQTFVDGLLGALTFGIYSPTTTKVVK